MIDSGERVEFVRPVRWAGRDVMPGETGWRVGAMGYPATHYVIDMDSGEPRYVQAPAESVRPHRRPTAQHPG